MSSFVMYLWRGNEVGEFWHFIEDTVLKKKKHERALLVDLGQSCCCFFCVCCICNLFLKAHILPVFDKGHSL